MTVRPGASYPPRTGVVPGVFLGGRMATGAGRVLLSWLAARPTLAASLGTAALVWHHGRQWLHLAPVCGGTLLESSAAVGRGSARCHFY